MKRKEFLEQFQVKYQEPLHQIFLKYQMDTSVCVDILVAWYRNLNVADRQHVYSFDGSETIDVVELAKDIVILEDNGVIPRLA